MRGVPTALVTAMALSAVSVGSTRAEEVVNLYSYRQPFLIEPFLERFTEKTGIKVNIVFAKKGLAQRLEAEGENTQADVLLAVDIARLSNHADKDQFQAVRSDVLNTNIPEGLRDPEGRWYGLSKRLRVVAASKDRVMDGEIQRIEELADPKWRDRICTRQGSHVYNRALLSSLIAHNGEAEAEIWATALVANLARKPEGNDRAQAKAIHEGVCDVAIMNHYYYGKMVDSDKSEQNEWAKSIKLVFLNQGDRGNHVNLSGAGVVKHAKNKENAVKLLEFLTGLEAQGMYSDLNWEYPANPNAKIAPRLAALGAVKTDDLPIVTIAEIAPNAQKMIDRVGW